VIQPTVLAAPDPALRFGRPLGGWRLALYTVIFEADTRAGRLFDLLLIWMILASVGVVMLDSFELLHQRWGGVFVVLEWIFTVLFTVEYLARLSCVATRRATRPASSASSTSSRCCPRGPRCLFRACTR